MTTITTRSGKGSALTHQELDDNFSNLNSTKLETSGNVSQSGNVAVTGQVSAATVSATGNITGNYILGNGSQLTGITGGVTSAAGTNLNFQYNNSGNFGGVPNTFFYSGNGTIEIASAKFEAGAGPSSQITVPGTAGYVSVTGNVIAGNVVTAGRVSATANVTGGNITTAGAITATGNITGNYFIGNGSQLTGITGGNATPGGSANTLQFNNGGVFGGISDSFHYTANGITEISKIKFSSTAAGGGSGELFVPGTVGYVSVVGNIIGGNISSAGQISATGTVTAGNIIVPPGGGIATDTISSPTGDFVTIEGVIAGSGIQSTGNAVFYDQKGIQFREANVNGSSMVMLRAPASLSSDLTFQLPDGYGSNAQMLTTDGTGNLSWSTASGAGGSPGGSDSQIQYNNGGAFGGNVAMTFNDTNGDIIMGNVAINGQRILPNNTGNLDLTLVTGNANPWQLRIGNSFNGNTNWAYNIFQPGLKYGVGPGSRVIQSDTMNMSNADMRFGGITSQNYINLTANATNNNSRYQGINSSTAILGGASGNTHQGTNAFNFNGIGSAFTVGNVNANLAAGNTTVNYATNYTGTIQVGAGSYIGNAIGAAMTFSYAASTGNIGNLVGYTAYSQSGPANANIVQSTSVASFFHPGSSGTILPAVNMGNIARMATNYHAFRNDDNLAKSKLGMVDSFHELNANSATTSGSVTIDKTNGQVQTIYPTGAITSMAFTNFVPRVQRPNASFVDTADTVTLIIQQGATPYAVTMPTGNTQIRYASGISTVGATANTTTMISVTAVYDYGAAATEYLVTISPEFS